MATLRAAVRTAADKSVAMAENIEAPVLACNRGHDGVMLPLAADFHEMSASRSMNHVAAAHRGVKASASARGGASDAPVALLIALNFLCVSRATGLLTGLMRAAAAACGRIGCRIALLGQCDRRGGKR
jgi:hypothetical protein